MLPESVSAAPLPVAAARRASSTARDLVETEAEVAATAGHAGEHGLSAAAGYCRTHDDGS